MEWCCLVIGFPSLALVIVDRTTWTDNIRSLMNRISSVFMNVPRFEKKNTMKRVRFPLPIAESFVARRFSVGQSEFDVGLRNGFLPKHDPLKSLPSKFLDLERLLIHMPMIKADGSEGLLAKHQLGDASSGVPEYNVEAIDEPKLLAALFRDYTFWASSYLLEPCHMSMLKSGMYGTGRQILPRNIAVPLTKVATKLNMKPFMEYATSYALYNWRRREPRWPIRFDNLELIRAFTGMPSEAGFILVHVAMVSFSKHQVKAVHHTLQAAEANDRIMFNKGLLRHLRAMEFINAEMETMWSRSNPNDYKLFRTFIMGIKNQPMFPDGVIYEGVDDEPRFYRGESGANDSIIPTADNLFQLFEKMPENPLTEILRDFRSYRPLSHTQWLSYVQNRAQELHIRDYALKDTKSAILMLENLDQIREFRQRHWNFTKEYILKHTNHPVATGGSPIVTWLPNQLTTVLKVMQETMNIVESSDQKIPKSWRKRLEMVKDTMISQDNVLRREVQQFSSKLSTDHTARGGYP